MLYFFIIIFLRFYDFYEVMECNNMTYLIKIDGTISERSVIVRRAATGEAFTWFVGCETVQWTLVLN